ncbi:hypothetical protein BH23CHL1_BH23CHL1_07240 [soil metagenome]
MRVRLLGIGVLIAILSLPLGASAQEAQLVIVQPNNGATIEGTSFTVEFTTTGFERVETDVPLEEAGQRPETNEPGVGHVHLWLDLWPVVVVDSGDSYTFENVPAGEHLLRVELATNDHSAVSPPVSEEIRFRTVSDMPVDPELALPQWPDTGAGGLAPGASDTAIYVLTAVTALIASSMSLGMFLARGRNS